MLAFLTGSVYIHYN